jgi:hypothetical protein
MEADENIMKYSIFFYGRKQMLWYRIFLENKTSTYKRRVKEL